MVTEFTHSSYEPLPFGLQSCHLTTNLVQI